MLQFDPSVYLAAFKNQQAQENYAPELYAKGLQGVGQGIESLAAIPDKQKQERLQQLMVGKQAMDSGGDPDAWVNFYRNGTQPQTPSEAPGLTSGQGSSLMPSMRPGQGLEASAGVSDAPRMPPGSIDPSQYETRLNPQEEQAFQTWKQQYAPHDSGYDYDLRGAFKAGLKPGANGHWDDTYKKPNHPTFSTYSQYAKDRPELAGTWKGETYVPHPPSSITQSPVIAAWNKSKGVQAPQAPGLFTRKPFDVNGILAQLKNGDASAISNLNDKQMKQLEATPAYIQMKKKEDMRTPGQVGALFPHLDPSALAREYPNGIPKEDLAFISSGLKADVTQGDKSDQFYQKEWDKIVKQTDPLTATSRSTLGLATKADYNANRALTTLSKPVVTNQEASNVMADIASIYQGGSATQFGMSHQAYSTLYGNIQGALQMISGKPQDAVPDEIKQRLVGVLQDMKGTNQAVLKQAFDSIEKSQPKVISHFANEWKGLRGNYEQGISGGPTNAPQVGEVRKGYRFKGGDPSQQTSWEKQ